MRDPAAVIAYKQRVLPAQIERAQERLRHLEIEAKRYGVPIPERRHVEAWNVKGVRP